jgi:hypothetical protein
LKGCEPLPLFGCSLSCCNTSVRWCSASVRFSPKADIVRHGSKSRDVGRVSQRGLGRLLARRPACHRLFALLRRRSASSSLRSAVLAVLQPPFCGLPCRMSRKHDRNHFSGAVSVNIVNIRGPALTLGTVDLVNFRSGKILQPRRNEGTSTPSHSLRNGAAGLAKTRINRFNGIARYAPVSCRLVRGELA